MLTACNVGCIQTEWTWNFCCRPGILPVVFYTTGAILLITGFTNGQGQIWLSDVQCDGTETRLIDCASNHLGVHYCLHYEDAGVSCPTCATGDIRLRGGSATSGRMEICKNAVWGTVCDDLWGNQDAQVVCRQLGYEPTGSFDY
jgi:deleted-in-malignant-brain-tumors protein 1